MRRKFGVFGVKKKFRVSWSFKCIELKELKLFFLTLDTLSSPGTQDIPVTFLFKGI